MTNVCYWVQSLGIAVTTVIVMSVNSATAQINRDDTLPNNFGTATQKSIKMIEYERNLTQNLKLFSVPTISRLYCKNTDDIQRIIHHLKDKYNILKNKEFNSSINPSQIQDKNPGEEKQITDYLPLVIPVKPIQLASCTCWSNDIHDFVTCPCH
ncbi:MAG: hypothetical protein RMY62_023925 [Nostoc sp. ZfuVER08]|jgi:hypothetical protein|nr:hypothetical protein [Nostoc sp. ZfuVER08]